ncbi:MAG: alpha/beta hydrolase [Casimicrobiaceae bacterium]|nr:alpha/beta hydrolase [Casimicrobiaceae bacterium]
MYAPQRPATRRYSSLRGHRASWLEWGAPGDLPTVVLLHGWMDVAASFQFLVDALAGRWHLVAPDQRGFGETEWTREPASGYWFPDYLADLEALLEVISHDRPVHLVGHSMGGNVACLYAGVRPNRVASLASLDGFGLTAADPARAADRYRRWLDAAKAGGKLKPYASLEAVADRLQKNSPRLARERALWLAQAWAEGDPTRGYRLRADPAHKLPFPTGYRLDEALAIWREVTAPTLWIGAEFSEASRWVGYGRDTRVPAPGAAVVPGSFEARLAAFAKIEFVVVEGAGHMLHHEAPEQVARLLERHWRSV